MAGHIWYKEGVMGQLQAHVRKSQGDLAEAYFKTGRDFYITSLQEGTHSAYSLHPLGLAFDYLPQSVPVEFDQKILGTDFDVIDEGDHRHAEFDPK